ncbi:MAG TPA: DUF1223 domain-containing protein, partial [Caulobacteraceae bacterium]
MRRALIAIACVCLAASAGTAEARGRRPASHGRHARPVVVELFTSQGCSVCVAADKVVDQLVDEPDVLALTFSVDYWDDLGWSDTFAKPEFSARQKAYEQTLALRDLYTPQIVVDGRGQVAGAETKRVEALIRKMRQGGLSGPRMRLHRTRLTVGSGHRPPGGAEVWLVRYDPSVQKVAVKRGENRGQVVLERNVVRQLVRLGAWSGRQKSYAVPAEGPGAA